MAWRRPGKRRIYELRIDIGLTNLPLVPQLCVDALRQHWCNGLSPVRSQAITWTSSDLLSIGHLGTNFNGIQIKIQNFSFAKMHLKCLLRNGVHFVQGQIYTLRSPEDLNSFCCCSIPCRNPSPWKTSRQWFIYRFSSMAAVLSTMHDKFFSDTPDIITVHGKWGWCH